MAELRERWQGAGGRERVSAYRSGSDDGGHLSLNR